MSNICVYSSNICVLVGRGRSSTSPAGLSCIVLPASPVTRLPLGKAGKYSLLCLALLSAAKVTVLFITRFIVALQCWKYWQLKTFSETNQGPSSNECLACKSRGPSPSGFSALQIPFKSQRDSNIFSYSGQSSPPLLPVLSLLCWDKPARGLQPRYGDKRTSDVSRLKQNVSRFWSVMQNGWLRNSWSGFLCPKGILLDFGVFSLLKMRLATLTLGWGYMLMLRGLILNVGIGGWQWTANSQGNYFLNQNI